MREVGSVYSEVALLLLRHEVQCGAGIMQIGALVKIQHSEVLTRGLYDYDVRQCFVHLRRHPRLCLATGQT